MKNNSAICDPTGTDTTDKNPDPTGTDPDPTGTNPDPIGTDPTNADPDPTGTNPDPTVTDVEDNTEMKKDQQLLVSTNAFFEVRFGCCTIRTVCNSCTCTCS